MGLLEVIRYVWILVLKVETMECLHCVRKRGVKNNAKIFGLKQMVELSSHLRWEGLWEE